ncbi:dihydrofolate reductase family protein [Dietzia natronolimnaea]
MSSSYSLSFPGSGQRARVYRGAMAKVVWGFTSSIDGFIAGPGHAMSWMEAAEPLADGIVERMAADVGVIIAGRDGYDAAKAQRDERDELTAEAYGGAWSGTEFILTHRPEYLADDPSVTALDCGIVEAVRRAREIAGEQNVQIISADIARQALEHDLIDELQVFVAPVFLGDGIRIFDVPGGTRVDWELVEIYSDSPRSFGRVYRPKGRVQ